MTGAKDLAIWIVVIIAMVGGRAALGQSPPSRPAHVGNLELVASLEGDQPAGIAISDAGRLFITFPRHDGPVPFTVGEMKDGHPMPFPNEAINHADPSRPADTLFSVQTLLIDTSNRIWMLDTGALQFGEPPVKGAPKLIAVDLDSGRVSRSIPLPDSALVPKSALKDFRLDLHRGHGGVAFITDSAPESEGLIVLDLASGRAVRRLSGSAAVDAHPGRTPIVGFEPLMEWPKTASKNGAPKPWLVGLNALELSADARTLYFSAFTGRRLYSIAPADLTNSEIANDMVSAEIKEVGDIGMAGHFVLDTDGRIYYMNMEQNAIFRRTADGRTQTVVMDARLMWPDTMAIGADQYLYVTTSQNDRRPEFHAGEELRQHPYGVFRVFIGSHPVKASEH